MRHRQSALFGLSENGAGFDFIIKPGYRYSALKGV